jgi:DNA-binding MarR family transcriptional regulator
MIDGMTKSLRAAGTPGAVVDELLAVSRILVAAAARSVSELGEDVTLAQYRALVALATSGPHRTSDLAVDLGVTSSTVTRMCDRLAGKGLIRRYRRSDDRRATWVGLTEPGRVLVGAVMRRRRAAVQRLVRSIPSEHHVDLAQGLHAFVEAAGEPPEDEWWRRWRIAARPDPLTVNA